MRKPLPHCLTALCAVLLSLRISAQTTSLPAASQTDSDTIRITHLNPLRGALSGTGHNGILPHASPLKGDHLVGNTALANVKVK